MPIPEAEDLVAGFRAQYDPSAAAGVPAHVTLLYPFKPPAELTADVLQNLADLFSQFSPFSVSFPEARRFPGALYLAPTPAEQFRLMTERVTERFPETPPYGGQFVEVIPHLTIADIGDARQLERISRDFDIAAEGRLPIQAGVSEIALWDNQSGRWQFRRTFALGQN